MENLSDILKNRSPIKILPKKPLKPRQLSIFPQNTPKMTAYRQSLEFSEYVGIPIGVVLKCVKMYGRRAVFNTRSFLKDYPTKKDKTGLLFWRLKMFYSKK